MRITQDQLAKMRAIREARNAAIVLPALVSTSHLSQLKKQLWTEIRRQHNLPADVKFKVELDGPNAGELRRKDNSQPYVPAHVNPMPGATQSAVGTERYVLIDEDGDDTVHNDLDNLFETIRDKSSLRVVRVLV